MVHSRLRNVGTLLILAVVLLGVIPVGPASAGEIAQPLTQTVGVNLLVNPGFEGIGRPVDNSTPNSGNWTRDTFNGAQYGEIYTPEGWVTWWQEGEFKRPECKVIPNEAPFNVDPKRVYQGYYSGMFFTFFGKQNAGYFQVVRNIEPGATLEAKFFAHAWSCNEDNPPLSCGDPNSFYFRVGIDPNGGTDPFSGNIVWSAPYFIYDKYGQVGPVQATAGASGAVTMFMQFYGKWPNKHNDAYSDNPSLVVLTQGTPPTATPEPVPPTSEITIPPTPQFTATPRPDGAVVHTVVSGDTLFGISLAYGVPLDELYRLNNMNSQSLLQIGQEIVVSVAAVPTPTPTLEVTPEVVVTEIATPESGTPAPAANKARLCVLAFQDGNGDMFRQDGEMLLPNAQVSVLGTAGPVGERTTDGLSEPWCFEDLEPGQYIVRHTAPSGYTQSDAGQWNLLLPAGQTTNLELGYMRDASGDSEGGEQGQATPTATPEEGGGGKGVTNVLNVVLRVAGVLVLLLAVGVLVLFVLSRRQA